MKRVFNFSAGPSALPLKVLQRAAEELVNYPGAGMSVMEMSHRSPMYEDIIFGARALLTELMHIPSGYSVLFLQGGATSQFSAVCYNLLSGSRKADYVITGHFARSAAEEARRYGDIRIAASSENRQHTYIPRLTQADFRPDADYVHICLNNTIYGTRWDYIPDTGDIPLVADISSCLLAQPLDVSRFGVLYAGAQKNLGTAGLTIVIVRDSLLGKSRPDTPLLYDWRLMAKNDSMYNTPPTWAIYMAKLVLEWLRDDMGGVEAMEDINRRKATVLYDYLDSSEYYITFAKEEVRSWTNVVFGTGNEALDKRFAAHAEQAGLSNLKGHRVVGGMRASLYNAMPMQGVEALVQFMKQFAQDNPKTA